MGAVFRLEHANIMTYLTSTQYHAPRVWRPMLNEFLGGLAHSPREYLIPERGTGEWVGRVSRAAQNALKRMWQDPVTQDDDVLPSRAVRELLADLRLELSTHLVFMLAVGHGTTLRRTAQTLASNDTHGRLLVLIPDQGIDGQSLEVIDPIPAFSTALHAVGSWPGLLVWTPSDASTFVALDQIDEFMPELLYTLDAYGHMPQYPSRNGHIQRLDTVLRSWTAHIRKPQRRLLHVSDLHFGTKHAARNQAMLDAELRDAVKSVHRVVITGDLVESPKRRYMSNFAAFRNGITYLANGVEPIAITGNHDQRKKGIFGRTYSQAALVGPMKIVTDDRCQMIFICFNSSESGFLARGRITDDQFAFLGAEYRNLLASRSDLRRYLPIVLVHHHPFPFHVPPETWMQRVLGAVGLDDEPLLEMIDAEKLHHWCLDWRIRTVLHGHKHKPRYIRKVVERGNTRMMLAAIGCGSSLGAEGLPLCYNMLEWSPEKGMWVASFYESVNGGAFHEIAASVCTEHGTED